MVKEEQKKDKRCYTCESCNMSYEEKAVAEKCEEWCHEHKSCNIDIIKHAIK